MASSTSGLLAWALARPSPRLFLPGPTSDGHHQIEESCSSCHTPLGGVAQEACLRCHGQELEEAHDSHPPSKFTDPRNAERTAVLDAARCVTCHREHRPEITRPMAVTLQDDFCFRCHADIGHERPTHAGLDFAGCASGGCHNFHDNRALYLDYVVGGAGAPDLLPAARLPPRHRGGAEEPEAPAAASMDAPAAHTDPARERAWAASAHAGAGVSCQSCHAAAPGDASWDPRPGVGSCGRCHQDEGRGFLAGKHGMRLAVGLTAMVPGLARQPMKEEAARRALGCGSCHEPHGLDTVRAALESCESCHDDAHTRAYRSSAHFRLWEEERRSPADLAGTGVSCATCHLPRREVEGQVRADHNQNANLRPNEKMVRGVCQRCHGLPFALAALADTALVKRNFSGPPAHDAAGIRMALDRRSARAGDQQQQRRSDR